MTPLHVATLKVNGASERYQSFFSYRSYHHKIDHLSTIGTLYGKVVIKINIATITNAHD